ncbi:unnamed protein product [Ceutorhynchus assimilis]|uniref:Fatty acyl-CoA reductase n=1 Tax=Ceutorhynchus assimilis TaxID=467358 RepID=A0A9N9MMJ7_9CUCU|nr:unnamed protein product [Ceutorhynchus assimilis]
MPGEIDRISELFKDKNVFISGASGFLGKILIEKLLRVTEVKTLYLLIRQKKNKSPKDRLIDIFNHVLFSTLKNKNPDVFKKCIIIQGDVLETNLGIIESDRILLQNKIDYIFHSAATTRFDETLKYSVQINTVGTKYMLDLANECKNLKLFVHISTAFAFPKEQILYEKCYDPPADPHEIVKAICSKENPFTVDMEQAMLADCPNTYTFSKSLAEGLVKEQMGKLPVIIVRPSVVIPTYKEPIPGFFNNLQSPMGIFVGGGKGVIRSVFMDSKASANLVPADSAINGILVSSWDYLTTKQQQVFNISIPHEDIKINWEEIIEIGKEVINTKVPFNGIIWYPNGILTKSRWWHNFNIFLFQIIPALFLDFLLICLGYKPVLLGINRRLLKGQEMFEYYTTKAWKIDMKYFMSLRRRMNEIEKKNYQVEAENVNIANYLKDCLMYARRHIFNETDDMIPAAKRNMKIFFVLDRIVKIGFFVLVFYYTYTFLFRSI